MYERHPYALTGVCPCKIGDETIENAFSIYQKVKDIKAFVEQMESHRMCFGNKNWKG